MGSLFVWGAEVGWPTATTASAQLHQKWVIGQNPELCNPDLFLITGLRDIPVTRNSIFETRNSNSLLLHRHWKLSTHFYFMYLFFFFVFFFDQLRCNLSGVWDAAYWHGVLYFEGARRGISVGRAKY